MTCELTDKQLKDANGCGSTFWALKIFRIPKWVSRAILKCCTWHDQDYEAQEDKDRADDEFYDCLYYNAFHSPWYQKWIKIQMADLFYFLVTSPFGDLAYRANGKDENGELI